MIPSAYRGHILFLGTDGKRFNNALQVISAIPKEFNVKLITVNPDPDRLNRIDSLAAIRRLNIMWRVLLLTHVPPEDIQTLKDNSVAVIPEESYQIIFHDGSSFDLNDVHHIVCKVSEMYNGL